MQPSSSSPGNHYASPTARRPLGYGLQHYVPPQQQQQQYHGGAVTSPTGGQRMAPPTGGSYAAAYYRDPSAAMPQQPHQWAAGGPSPNPRSPTMTRYDTYAGYGTAAALDSASPYAASGSRRSGTRPSASPHPYFQQQQSHAGVGYAPSTAAYQQQHYRGAAQYIPAPTQQQQRRSSSSMTRASGAPAGPAPTVATERHPAPNTYVPTPTAAAGWTSATPQRRAASTGRSADRGAKEVSPIPVSASPAHVRHTLRCHASIVDEVDPVTGSVVRRYQCGGLLGKGGFAKVYHFTDLDTREQYAAKVIDKTKLTDQEKYQKLLIEINIHASLDHPHVVKIHRHFEDSAFMYILLELCPNQTLLELSKARGSLSMEEVQFVMLQLLQAVAYLHRACVIHRDLKLANVLVDDALQLKVGDFGLAAAVATTDEVKRTMCGTPNYIAPEILTSNSKARKGYNYRADLWSLGVILYTLVVGNPPFETPDLKTTYDLIQRGSYSIPPGVPPAARNFIMRILKVDPDSRPSLVEMRSDPFFAGCRNGLLPPRQLIEYYARLQNIPVRDLEAHVVTVYDHRQAAAAHAAMHQQRQQQQQQQQQAAVAALPVARRLMAPEPLAFEATELDDAAAAYAAGGGRQPDPLAERLATISPLAAPTVGPQSQASPTSANAVQRPNSPMSPTIGGGDDFMPGLHNAIIVQQVNGMARGVTMKWTGAPVSARQLLQHVVCPMSAAHQQHVQQHLVFVADLAVFHRYGLAFRLNTGHYGAFFNDRSKLVFEPITGMTEYHDRPPRAPTTTTGGAFPPQTTSSTALEKFNILRDSDPFLQSANKKKATLGRYFRDFFVARRSDAARYVAFNADPAPASLAADAASAAAALLVTCHIPVADTDHWETMRATMSGPPVLTCVPGSCSALLRDGRASLEAENAALLADRSPLSSAAAPSTAGEFDMPSVTSVAPRMHATSHVVGLLAPDTLSSTNMLSDMPHVRRSAVVGFENDRAMIESMRAPIGLEAWLLQRCLGLSGPERAAVAAVLRTACAALPVAAAVLKLSNGDSQVSFFTTGYASRQNVATPSANEPSQQQGARDVPLTYPPMVVGAATLVFHCQPAEQTLPDPTPSTAFNASSFSILAETSSAGLGDASYSRYDTAASFRLLHHITTDVLASVGTAALRPSAPTVAAVTAPSNAASGGGGEVVLNLSDVGDGAALGTRCTPATLDDALALARAVAACVWLQRSALVLEGAPAAKGVAAPGTIRMLGVTATA